MPLFIIFFIYFLLRIPHLTLQPIFADEAIYIHWAKIISETPDQIFIPLTDGKTPLFMWLLIPLLKIFNDPLFAGRFLSIISGFLTLLGTYQIGKKFFNKRVALWSALLISLIPFSVFFDRMALVDSMLAAFSIWSLYFSLNLIKTPKVHTTILLGLTLGGGILTKTPGIISFYLLPITLFSINWTQQKNFIKVLVFGLLSVALGLIIYHGLQISPLFNNLSTRDQDYQFPLNQLLTQPLNPFLPHISLVTDWLNKLLTLPITILVLGAILVSIIKLNRLNLTMLLWSLIPLITEMALLKVFTARYILFCLPPLIVLVSWFIDLIWQNINLKLSYTILMLIILIFPAIKFDTKLLKDPATAPLPNNERQGYLEDWTAGYGLKQIAEYLTEQAQYQKIAIFTQESFGILPDGLAIYLPDNPNILLWGSLGTSEEDMYSWATQYPTYFVASKTRFNHYPKLTLLEEFPKAKGKNIPQDAMMLFKVNP